MQPTGTPAQRLAALAAETGYVVLEGAALEALIDAEEVAEYEANNAEFAAGLTDDERYFLSYRSKTHTLVTKRTYAHYLASRQA